MRLHTLFLITLPVIIVAWWLLNEDPDQEVRDAHAELVRLVEKSAGDATGLSLLDARAFQSLFADSCEISGDANGFAGTYSPDELFGRVAAMQARFDSIELSFGELTIVFPTSDVAAVSFIVTLGAQSANQRADSVVETRNVVSQMRELDGEWLFTGFRLTDY